METKPNSDNLVVTIYSILLERIIKFSLAPGAFISDNTISKEMGTSRTPVREALLRLEDDGLLTRKNQKFYVTEISSEYIKDLFDARLALETSMLRLAMQKKEIVAIVPQLRELNENLHNSIDSGKLIEAIELDCQIHAKMVETCGNSFLMESYWHLEKQLRRMAVFSIVHKKQTASIEHEDIFRSIEAGDVSATCEATATNIELSKQQHLDTFEYFRANGWLQVASFIWGNLQCPLPAQFINCQFCSP